MTSAIETVYNEFRSEGRIGSDYTIDFFETSSIGLSDFKTFKTKEDLKLFIELVWQYTNALFSKKRYNETIDKTIKYFPIIASEIERFGDNTLKCDSYYDILLMKGLSSYHLRDYKAATYVLKQVVAHDPKNESNQSWLSYSIYGQRLWINQTVSICCLILVATDILFGHYIPSPLVRISLSGIAFLGFLGINLYDYYFKRSRRKSKLK